MYTIPKALIAEWDDVKKQVLKAPDQAKMGWGPGEKAKLKADVAKMVADFDQGLKAKMKLAAAAKNDASAQRAASAVAAVVNSYRKTAKTHAEKMGYLGSATIKGLDSVLADIAKHAEASMKSRAPIAVPADLYEKFKKGLTEVSKQADAQNSKAVATLAAATDLSIKGAILSVKHAMSDPDLYDHAKALRVSITTSRKIVKDRVKAGKWGAAVGGGFDREFDELDQRVRALIHTLETESARVPTQV